MKFIQVLTSWKQSWQSADCYGKKLQILIAPIISDHEQLSDNSEILKLYA
jgi:hypothetical protein